MGIEHRAVGGAKGIGYLAADDRGGFDDHFVQAQPLQRGRRERYSANSQDQR